MSQVAEAVQQVQTTDLNFLMCGEQLGFMATGPGGVPAGIDPSLLTSAAFELVQASQALQAVQAVQPLLGHAESPPMMTPLTQDPALLSSMDPAQIAAAVQHCPIPLDSALQVATAGGTQVQLQYSGTGVGVGVAGSVSSTGGHTVQVPLLTDCSQHAGTHHQPQPITNFGHQLLLPAGQFAFGPSCGPPGGATSGLPVQLETGAGSVAGVLQQAEGGTSVLAPQYAGLQLQAGAQAQEQLQAAISFPGSPGIIHGPEIQSLEKKKVGSKKKGSAASNSVLQQAAQPPLLEGGGVVGMGYPGQGTQHYLTHQGAPAVQVGGSPQQQQQQQQAYSTGYTGGGGGVPVVDLDSETDSNHDTALTLACAGGHEELVTLLLSRGADIEHRDKKGFTPLILAATAGHDKVVEILLNHGADIEAQSERTKDTPLSLACSGGRYEVVEILLSRGANKEHRNVSDYTPLSLAASGGYTNIIKLLLAHGAEINSRTGSKLGISPLMLAAMNGHTAAVKLLLDMGSDINAQIETNRNTALTLACFQGRHEVVSLLLDRKANVEHRAKTGLTPLMEAASGGYTEVGRVLLDKGADVNAAPVPSSRDTALTIAADKGHYRFVELLLSRGAQVDVRNKKGNSSLWLAANGGHLDVVQLLYSAGADIDSQDNRKVSCLMAAFRKGHSKVVKWLVKHVTQFPSDTELTRFIATISDKDLLKKTHQCLEIIRVAKERQASEANKAASILLEELEQEKSREESKKAAAARKREKKKRKKAEKRGKVDEEEDDIEEEDKDDVKESEDATEDEKEKSPEINAEGDSGIDANSQGSGASNDKEEKNNKKRKNKKKSKEKERNEKNMEEKENNVVPSHPDSKEKTPEDERPDSRSDRNSQPRVPCTIEGHSAPEMEKPNGNLNNSTNLNKIDAGFIEPPRKGRNRRQTESFEHNKVEPLKATTVNNSKKPSNKSAPTQDAGWKEVVRKSKKVSVPSNAISRVIGRGGSNINAVRELSGAHIEVEKQSKGQGDRTILIKGSAEATRMANTWISAIIANPDKDLVEIVGRQQYKTLTSVASKNAQTVVVTKTVVKTVVTTATGQVQKSKSTEGKVGKSSPQVALTCAATITTTTKMTVAYSGPVMTAKTKPVTSTSFAAIAAGNEGGFGMIPTGPPPALAIKTSINSNSVPLKQSASTGPVVSKKKEETPGSVPPLMPVSSAGNGSIEGKDYSPFKTFKVPGAFGNWGSEQKIDQQQQGFKGFAAPNSTAASNNEEQLAKAPGYRQGGGSPNSWSMAGAAVSSAAQSTVSQPVAPPTSSAPGYKKSVPCSNASTSASEVSRDLYSGPQERCNSAPGTPGSPIVPPSPIAPPPPRDQLERQLNHVNSVAPGGERTVNKNNGSPGSEPEWFRGPSAIGSGLRSMTPDGDLDRSWGGVLRSEELESSRRHGTGSYGHNSPAKAPGAPIPDLFGRTGSAVHGKVDPATGLNTENILSAAAQLSNLSVNNFDMLATTSMSTPPSIPLPGSVSASLAPGIPLPEPPQAVPPGQGPTPSSFNRFGLGSGVPRFTAPTQATTPIFSQPPAMSVQSPAMPKGLNPNAPDFNRGGLYNSFRGNTPHRVPPGPSPPQPPKPGNAFGYNINAGVIGNNFGQTAQAVGSNNFQNILTNQGINAYLSTLNLGNNMNPPPLGDPMRDPLSSLAGLADLNLGGRTLSEITDMLGPDAVLGYNPGNNINEMEPKFSSRPIGAERQRTGPSPLGHSMAPGGPSLGVGVGVGVGVGQVQSRKVDPFGVWDLPPSYTDNLSSANLSNDSGFGLLPASLSGQTLQSALDNLTKGGVGTGGAFNDLQFNGGSTHTFEPPSSVSGALPVGAVGQPGQVFSLTPVKAVPDSCSAGSVTPGGGYSEWGTGSTSGSAPASANKNLGQPGEHFRGDPQAVRRNMNQMWPKEWET